MSSLESGEASNSKHGSPEKTADSIGRQRIDASFVESAHSHLFEEIRSIPTGKYYRSPIVDKFEKNAPIALMGKEQLQNKIKNNFKGIFQANAFESSIDLGDGNKLPKIIQKNETDRDLSNRPTIFKKSMYDMSSPRIMRKDYKNNRPASLEPSLKLKTLRHPGSQTVKNSSVFARSSAEKDPVMQLYTTATNQIRENIGKAQAVKQQMMLMNDQNNNKETDHINMPSNFSSKKFIELDTFKSNEFGHIPRGITMNTIQHPMHHMNNSGQASGQDEQFTNASTMHGTLAGAKNQKFKAQFRLNQNSQLQQKRNSNTNSKSKVRLHSDISQMESKPIMIPQNINSNSNQMSMMTTIMSPQQYNSQVINPNHFQTYTSGNFGGLNTKSNMNDQYMEDLLELNGRFLNYNNTFYNKSPGHGRVNKVEQNIDNIKDYKSVQMETYRQQIGQIHYQLMNKKSVSSGKDSNLTQIQKLLVPHLKEIFLNDNNVEHNQLFKDMNNLNGSFLDILDSVSTYKAELAITLQKLIESYNSVFLQQYNVFYKGKLEKEIELDKQIQIQQSKQKEAEKERDNLKKKQTWCEEAIGVKDSEIERLLEVTKNLEKTINDQYELIQNTRMADAEIKEDFEKKQKEIDDKPFMNEKHQRQKRVALKQNPDSILLHDPENIPDSDAIHKLFLTRFDQREEYLTQVYELTKTMMSSKQKTNVKTQTDQACMNNAMMYDYVSYGEEETEEGADEATNKENSLDSKVKKLMEEKGINVEEVDDDAEDSDDGDSNEGSDEVKELDSKGQQVESKKSMLKNTSGRLTTKQSKQSLKKGTSKVSIKSGQKSKVTSRRNSKISSQPQGFKGKKEPSDFSLIEPASMYTALTMRQTGQMNGKQMKYLHDLLEKSTLVVKKRKMQEMNDDPTKLNSREQWKIPFKIIAFVQNRIRQLDEDKSILEKYELMPWFQFKDILFDLYDHRIKYAPELNGAANTSYCALNEHLIMFFVEKYDKRHKAEEKIVDVLINLRYWYDQWPRAKLFAQNLELTYLPTDSHAIKMRKQQHEDTQSSDGDEYGDPKIFEAPHGFIKDQDVNDNDIYSQEFFLHCFALLNEDRVAFVESREGYTYVRVKHHDKISSKIINLIRGPCGDLQKWNLKIRRMVKKIKNKQGTEQDYLELDLIIQMMMDEYKNQRRLYQKDLQKQFMRKLETNEGPVDFSIFQEMITEALPLSQDSQSLDNPYISFPSKISAIRAYIYSCTCGRENTNVFNDGDFLAGCTRFAIENPVPTVSTRVALYGNSKDIKIQLEDFQKKQDKQFRIDFKQFTSVSMGLVEKKDFSSRRMVGAFASQTEESMEADIEALRKATIEGYETEQAAASSVFQFKVGPKNMKLQVPHYMDNKLGRNQDKDHVLIGKYRMKISKIQKKVEDEGPMVVDLEDADPSASPVQKKKKKGGEVSVDELTASIDADMDEPTAKKEIKQKITSKPKQELTLALNGLSKKQIIVPSFQTTSKLFQEHLLILKELKGKIDLLKQAYYGQMDKKKTWEQVDSIIGVLKAGCEYLDFPEEVDIKKLLVADDVQINEQTSPLLSSKSLFGARAGFKGPNALRIETGDSPNKEGEDDAMANTILENIAEENGQEDGDSSIEKKSKTENENTNEMEADGEFQMEQSNEIIDQM